VKVELYKLERGINVLEMISEQMEITMQFLTDLKVPPKWITMCYASMKPF